MHCWHADRIPCASIQTMYRMKTKWHSVTGMETIEVDKIGLKFDKSSGLVSLSNVAESSFVRVVDINGRLVQTNSIEGSKSFSFNLKPGSGLNIVSLYNYDVKLVKSFKIIR